MAQQVGYQVTVGSQIASSTPRQGDRQLLSLVVELGMDSIGGRCVLELSRTETDAPKKDDAVSVTMEVGGVSAKVFTGEVEAVQVGTTAQRIQANDGLTRLARMDLELAYEDVDLDFIVKDLLQQAAVPVGTVVRGPKLSSYVLHRGPRALRHLIKLAELCGADLYTDGEGSAHFATPRRGPADHRFSYGATVLDLDLLRARLVFDGVTLWGEGAASSRGADKAHWLTTDLSGVSAKTALDETGETISGKAGKRPLQITDGALRSGETAQACADGRMAAVAARAVQGHVTVSGIPSVTPGDLVQLDDLPESQASLLDGHLLRVRTVRHTLDRRHGFVTRMAF